MDPVIINISISSGTIDRKGKWPLLVCSGQIPTHSFSRRRRRPHSFMLFPLWGVNLAYN